MRAGNPFLPFSALSSFCMCAYVRACMCVWVFGNGGGLHSVIMVVPGWCLSVITINLTLLKFSDSRCVLYFFFSLSCSIWLTRQLQHFRPATCHCHTLQPPHWLDLRGPKTHFSFGLNHQLGMYKNYQILFSACHGQVLAERCLFLGSLQPIRRWN